MEYLLEYNNYNDHYELIENNYYIYYIDLYSVRDIGPSRRKIERLLNRSNWIGKNKPVISFDVIRVEYFDYETKECLGYYKRHVEIELKWNKPLIIKRCKIFAIKDEYFIVRFDFYNSNYIRKEECYKCDQFSGLVMLLKDKEIII